jgi:SAM-dependent methyltransferase
VARSLPKAVAQPLDRLRGAARTLRDIDGELEFVKANQRAVALALANLETARGADDGDDGAGESWRSAICTQQRLTGPTAERWCKELDIPHNLERWVWEKIQIARALDEAGAVGPGKRGLGFGVGREGLVAWFAARGCDVTATELAPDDARAGAWTGTGTTLGTLEALQRPNLCDPAVLAERVTTRWVDMNDVPDDLVEFDFTWSACCLEHLGDLDAGMRFVERSLDCLKPGGIAVHTTEFNLASNDRTLDTGGIVLYRRRDIDALAQRLAAAGHELAPLDLDNGPGVLDWFVSDEPSQLAPALRVRIGGYVSTTLALVIRKAA